MLTDPKTLQEVIGRGDERQEGPLAYCGSPYWPSLESARTTRLNTDVEVGVVQSVASSKN